MSTFKVNRRKTAPFLIRLGEVGCGWYSYHDDSGVIFVDPTLGVFMQFSDNNTPILNKISLMETTYVYRIDVEVIINVLN